MTIHAFNKNTDLHFTDLDYLGYLETAKAS